MQVHPHISSFPVSLQGGQVEAAKLCSGGQSARLFLSTLSSAFLLPLYLLFFLRINASTRTDSSPRCYFVYFRSSSYTMAVSSNMCHSSATPVCHSFVFQSTLVVPPSSSMLECYCLHHSMWPSAQEVRPKRINAHCCWSKSSVVLEMRTTSKDTHTNTRTLSLTTRVVIFIVICHKYITRDQSRCSRVC